MSHNDDVYNDQDVTANNTTSSGIHIVAVDAIRANRSQPRTHFDQQSLAELSASIREHGVLQPLIVTTHEIGGYELIAGERRLRAAQQAGLQQVPVLIKDATPQQLLELALVENVQRADLNPLEEGRAYQTLKDEFGLTDEEIAQRVGKSRVAVVNARRLTRLDPIVQQDLVTGTISAGHGRALLRLDQPDQQAAALALIQREGLSVREVERLCDLVQSAQLSSHCQQLLLAGKISIGQGEALRRLDVQQQDAIIQEVLNRNLDPHETEYLTTSIAANGSYHSPDTRTSDLIDTKSAQSSSPSTVSSLGAHMAEEASVSKPSSPEDELAQRMFEEVLGTPVQITRSNRGIRLMIMLYSDEQLQGLYELVANKL